MLSTGAFNALLKTLEEPPKHVIFILATTEPQKLPVTILSRCQRFDFKRISIDDIIKRLKIICAESNIEIEDGALKIIAKMSDGAMRDAISILERCVADGSEKISEDQIRELVGIPEIDYLLGMTRDILEGDAAKVLQDSENLINSGKDLDVFTWELIKFIRDLLMLQISDNLVVYKDEEKARMQALINNCTKDRLLELITEISLLQNSMKWATDKEVIFEAGLIRITLSDSLNNTNSIAKQVSNQNAAGNASNAPSSATTLEKVLSEDENTKEEVLNLLKESHKMIMHTILKNAEIKKVEEDLVHIIFNKTLDEVNKQYMQKDESKITIKEMIKKAFNKEMKIKYVF